MRRVFECDLTGCNDQALLAEKSPQSLWALAAKFFLGALVLRSVLGADLCQTQAPCCDMWVHRVGAPETGCHVKLSLFNIHVTSQKSIPNSDPEVEHSETCLRAVSLTLLFVWCTGCYVWCTYLIVSCSKPNRDCNGSEYACARLSGGRAVVMRLTSRRLQLTDDYLRLPKICVLRVQGDVQQQE